MEIFFNIFHKPSGKINKTNDLKPRSLVLPIMLPKQINIFKKEE
ncbi:Hypothetical protein IALB_1828 [Ignavibacterium album JCM 16511]|uniref:Uncharacterized protein n=1 Tax=Ignavibacterium album (strain DSM 19864 / JCM 16511 / NBRC 101810 / Mat9-16) TaxID=945713 RepID=I0AKM8_IGNAJ|nr:Hypothetical protein IALB_1828 [Ignavibacterium album JCM 16511]